MGKLKQIRRDADFQMKKGIKTGGKRTIAKITESRKKGKFL